MYQSETSKYREELKNFCEGYGIDIGFGGDPIKSSAVTIDNPQGCMAHCGDHPMNLAGDARKLGWFRDGVLDYVYSSHCLEDFENTKEILIEWLRVLKTGGKLVLLLPNQKRYEETCEKAGVEPNAAHKIKEFGLDYVKKVLEEISGTKVIFEKDNLGEYNFALVAEKK